MGVYYLKKVLHILNSFSIGGAESFILNSIAALENKDIEFNFLLRSNVNENLIRLENVGKVFIAPPFPKNVVSNYVYTKNFLKNNQYDYIHFHMNSLVYTYPIYLSKKYNRAKVIVHSHNSFAANFLASSLHKTNKQLIDWKCIKCIACSDNAGKWMFNQEYSIVNNSIDLKKFYYDYEVRRKIRKELKIKDDDILLGNVGRMVNQKNQKYLLDIIEKLDENYKLLIVGDGELKADLARKILEKKLESRVILLGNTNNVEQYLLSMDMFLMPSFYEGFSIALVEAQASGLPVFINKEALSIDSPVTDLVKSISLTNINRWTESIRKYNLEYDRTKYLEIMERKGLGIDNLQKNLVELYSLEE